MIQEDLIESISKYISVSEKKIDPVQKIIDVQTGQLEKSMLELSLRH